MKTIALLRHAKSDWGESALADIERPLAPRGFANAPLMGDWIAAQGNWERALVSPALRARQTFESIEIEIPMDVEDLLYPTQAGHMLRILQKLDNNFSEILVVAHNPGISRAVNTFCSIKSDDPKIEEMPTCACAVIQFDCEKWSELDYGQAKLKAFMTPKRLK